MTNSKVSNIPAANAPPETKAAAGVLVELIRKLKTSGVYDWKISSKLGSIAFYHGVWYINGSEVGYGEELKIPISWIYLERPWSVERGALT